jgi:cellulose synthase/poly-beta-1,6-N-acetylglucosamine synthase-like glycosyltransferase
MSADVIEWLVASVPAAVWVMLLLLPWRPWSTRERIDADAGAASTADLSDITVVIPARNEADVIAATLTGLQEQGGG